MLFYRLGRAYTYSHACCDVTGLFAAAGGGGSGSGSDSDSALRALADEVIASPQKHMDDLRQQMRDFPMLAEMAGTCPSLHFTSLHLPRSASCF